MAQFVFPAITSSLPAGSATAANQALEIAELQDINTELNTQTIALGTLATEATLSSLAAEDFATETTLAALNAKVTVVNTGAVVVSSSALPTGASTSALQTTGNTSLATIAGAISGTEMQVDVLTMPSVTVTATNLDIRDLSSVTDSITAVATDLDIRDLTSVSDSISAVQSGTWNINNVSGTVSLPTGAATSANQTTANGHLATLAGTVVGTEVQVDVLTLPAITATDLDIRDLSSATDSVTVVATNLDVRDLTSVSDSVSAVQSGTWNINNVSGTVSLPTGASTSALQTTANTSLSNIESDIDALNARLGGSLTPVTHDYLALTYVPSGNGVGEISTVVYKTGGSGGTTVATLTLAYDSSNRLTSVTRS